MQRQHDSFGRGGRCYTREKRGDSRFREKGWNEVSKIYIFAGEIGFAIKGFRIKFNSAWYAPVHAAVGILIQQSFESWQALWSAANIFMLFLLPLPPQTVHRPRLPFRRPLPLPFLLSSRSPPVSSPFFYRPANGFAMVPTVETTLPWRSPVFRIDFDGKVFYLSNFSNSSKFSLFSFSFEK